MPADRVAAPETLRDDASATERMNAFIAWVNSGGGREWLLPRLDARRIVDEIEWGWAAAKRELEIATNLDALLADTLVLMDQTASEEVQMEARRRIIVSVLTAERSATCSRPWIAMPADRVAAPDHLRDGDILGIARDVLDGKLGTAHPECGRALNLLAQGVVSLAKADAKHQRRLVNAGEHVIAIVDKNKGFKLDVKRLEDLLVWIYRKAPPIEEIRETLDHAIRTRIGREREAGRL